MRYIERLFVSVYALGVAFANNVLLHRRYFGTLSTISSPIKSKKEDFLVLKTFEHDFNAILGGGGDFRPLPPLRFLE